MPLQDPGIRTLEQLSEMWMPSTVNPEEAKTRLERLKARLDEFELDGHPISIKDVNGEKHYDFHYVSSLRVQYNRIHHLTNRPPNSTSPIPNSRCQITLDQYPHP